MEVAGRQRIDRVRRQYNQWVANQTLEDYALRFTAKSARRWSADRLQGQERDGAQRGVGDPGGGPAPRAFGREAQRVVFQRLVGNPLIILAPDAVYPLPPCHFGTPDPKALRLQSPCKIYVAILRCNIRDLAYLCTAQFQQSSLGQ